MYKLKSGNKVSLPGKIKTTSSILVSLTEAIMSYFGSLCPISKTFPSALNFMRSAFIFTLLNKIPLSTVEKSIKDLKDKSSKNLDRWVNPLVSALVSGIVAFIFVKVGLK